MSTTTKKIIEGLDARIAALECVSEGNSNFLILKRDIQTRSDEMAQKRTDLLAQLDQIRAEFKTELDTLQTKLRSTEDKLTAVATAINTLMSDLSTHPLNAIATQLHTTDQQHIISRIDAIEVALRTSDTANRALWKKLLYGVQRQT
jgi:chromosome segregation ATPase